jgi:hypothetical protein
MAAELWIQPRSAYRSRYGAKQAYHKAQREPLIAASTGSATVRWLTVIELVEM